MPPDEQDLPSFELPPQRKPDPTRTPRTANKPGRPRKAGPDGAKAPRGSRQRPLETIAALGLRARRTAMLKPASEAPASSGAEGEPGLLKQRMARRVAEAESMRLTDEQLAVRARTTSQAMAVLASDDSLKYLDRSYRLAWLCGKVAQKSMIVAENGDEIDDNPQWQFKAMDMLMRALGDFDAEHHGSNGEQKATVIVAMSDLHEELGRRLKSGE